MLVYQDGDNGTYYVQCYYRDARGSKRHKTKRGFSTEVEAASKTSLRTRLRITTLPRASCSAFIFLITP